MGAVSAKTVTLRAPYIYLFPYETAGDPVYDPASVDYYLQNVQLISEACTKYPPLDGASLASAGTDATLSIPNDSTATSPVRAGNFKTDTVPVYVHIRPVAGASGVFDIQYWLFYAVRGRSTGFVADPFNWTGDLIGPTNSDGGYTDGYQGLGEHQGDWKVVVVRVRPTADPAGELIGVYYSQHDRGVYRFGSDVPLNGTQPVVYSARNTHSCFPDLYSGPQINANETKKIAGFTFGVGLHEVTGTGPVWDTSTSICIIQDDTAGGDVTPQQWLEYLGAWSPMLKETVDPSTFVHLPQVIRGAVKGMLEEFVQQSPEGARSPMYQSFWIASYALPFPYVCVHRGRQDDELWYCSFDPSSTTWSRDTPFDYANGHRSSAAPAVAAYDDALYCAHVGRSGDPQLWWSTFDPVRGVWTTDQPFKHDELNFESSAGPALAVYRDVLYCAHVGAGSDHDLWWCSFDATTSTWDADRPFDAKSAPQSSTGPALAVLDDMLYCAHIGPGSDRTLSWCTFDPGSSTWVDDTPFGGTHLSAATPALAAFDGVLYCAHLGTDGDPSLYWCSFDPTTKVWSPDEGFDAQPSGNVIGSPALMVVDGTLYCVYATTNGELCWRSLTGSAQPWSPEAPFDAAPNVNHQTSAGPALASLA